MTSTRRRAPSLESLFVAAVVLFGFRVGARPIGDNSMFTHLRTGIDMAAGGGIPRRDPYSHTAAGHEWVVQSWFPELLYGWADRLWDLRLVILQQGVLTALLAWLVVRLARAGTPLRTAAAGVVAVGTGAAYWSPRPLLFGLVALALLVTVVERGASPWWLVPLVWVWVNSHGSFPLGLAWLGARAVGEWADGGRRPGHLAPYGIAFAGGLVASALNPLGPRLLLFPLAVVDKREVFETIVEWRSPDFATLGGRFTLAFLGVALAILFRARVPWRHLVPGAAFVVLGLIALRNLPAAGIVLAPALAGALRAPSPAEVRRPVVNSVFLGVIALAAALFAVDATSGRLLDTGDYPVRAVTWLDAEGLLAGDHRLAHQDTVGNYLTLRYGDGVRVFVDDRYDMYPVAVARDYTALLEGGPDAMAVLDRRRVDVVLWERDLALVALLRETDGWRQVYVDGEWAVLRRRS